MSKYPRPNYYITQDRLIVSAGIQINLLEEYLDRFYSIDLSFTEDFLNQYRILSETVNNTLSDKVIRARMAQHTEAVKSVTKNCKLFYHKVKHFVKQAFPDSVTNQNRFGLNKFEKVKYSKADFLQFMNLLNAVLLQYEDMKPAREIPPEIVTESGVLYKKLEQVITAQDTYKRERSVLTAERIKNMNKIWEFMVLISRLAKIVFKEEPALMNLFMLPKKRKSDRHKSKEEQATEEADHS